MIDTIFDEIFGQDDYPDDESFSYALYRALQHQYSFTADGIQKIDDFGWEIRLSSFPIIEYEHDKRINLRIVNSQINHTYITVGKDDDEERYVALQMRPSYQSIRCYIDGRTKIFYRIYSLAQALDVLKPHMLKWKAVFDQYRELDKQLIKVQSNISSIFKDE